MERKIGETFDGGDGHFYKCVGSEDICNKCDYKMSTCHNFREYRGSCCGSDREDMQEVIFVLADDGTKGNPVTHPSHYTGVVPGIECIRITQHFNFNRGNAIKYLWRAGEKDKTKEIEDLEKARQYIDFEIARVKESQKTEVGK